MSDSDSDREPSGLSSREGTSVDLGEDLLEFTAGLLKPDPDVPPSPLEDPGRYRSDRIVDISDALKSANILISEGLYDEAKKVLHSALRLAPHHVLAREKLKTLHELELKQIFSGQQPVKIPTKKSADDLHRSSREIDELARRLDQDLSLGLLSVRVEGTDSIAGLSLFQDEAELERYAHAMDLQMSDLSSQQRIDVGVGFLEMDLPTVAIPQFRSALRLAESANDGEMRLSALNLLAFALIQSNKPYEAVLLLESVVGDSELEMQIKVHFFYLMGRALDVAGKLQEAKRWYLKCHEIEPYYRDVADRIRGK